MKANGTYRSRLVVREIKKMKKEADKLDPADVFSATPPVEALKMLISELMNESDDVAEHPTEVSGSAIGGADEQFESD